MSTAKAWAAHIGWGLLILADVLLNMLIAIGTPSYLVTQAWKETMSSRAGRMREKDQPVWGFLAYCIDDLAFDIFGQTEHCKKQVARESPGGVWKAWRAEAPNASPPQEGGASP